MGQQEIPADVLESFWLLAEPVYEPMDEMTRLRVSKALDVVFAAGVQAGREAGYNEALQRSHRGGRGAPGRG